MALITRQYTVITPPNKAAFTLYLGFSFSNLCYCFFLIICDHRCYLSNFVESEKNLKKCVTVLLTLNWELLLDVGIMLFHNSRGKFRGWQALEKINIPGVLPSDCLMKWKWKIKGVSKFISILHISKITKSQRGANDSHWIAH